MRRRVELLAPQLLAVARVERAEDAVDCRADEDEIAGGRDAAAEAGRTGHGMPLAASSGNSPSGMCHAMSPVFALTATSSPHGGAAQLYLCSASQNRPPSGVTLFMFGAAGVPGGDDVFRRSGGSPPARPPRPAAAPAPRASRRAVHRRGHRDRRLARALRDVPTGRCYDVRDNQPERLIEHHALPVATADRAREQHDVLLFAPRACTAPRPRGCTSPKALAVRLELRRDLRELLFLH